MTGTNRAKRLSTDRRRIGVIAVLLLALAGCNSPDVPATVSSSPVTLTVAFGFATGADPRSGAQQALGIFTQESLIGFGRDGRPQARLAERWSVSSDGLTLNVHLRAGATFHDGRPVSGHDVSDIVASQLRGYMGPAFEDIEAVRAASPLDVEFKLKRRSNFVLEALDVPVQAPGPAGAVGTGPFKPASTDANTELVANENFYAGRPSIDRIQIKPYTSVRAAWADMLRDKVDMLYEVGPDIIDLLEPSKTVRVVTHQRNYAYVVVLNVQRPGLRDREFRRLLNLAINREQLVADVLRGHGSPASGGVLPSHWAYDRGAPMFTYQPQLVAPPRRSFDCLLVDPSVERLGLAIQKQLYQIGVDMKLVPMPLDKGMEQVRAGDFDAILADVQMGPTLLQQYRFVRPGSGRNWSQFNNGEVNAALDRIRDAMDDDAYRAGVSALQRAIVDDPPAIFIAWSERARAVSTRFEVPVEPGRDILGTLRLWKPVAEPALATRN